MKIIIDTNVLVSAIIADGKPENTVDFIMAKDDWEWIVSEPILNEYRQVLNRPKFQKKLTDLVKQKWLNILEEATTKVEVAVEVNFPRDRKDEKFLACAIVSQANFLITGDYDFEEMQALLPATTIISVALFQELVINTGEDLSDN
ncbi:MAG: putative toxin-antitoxin system toxin component, PIN family [Okeania sp. SIO3I5]|uniref:putative toxin-antitoxin system toxin component, PIN family n=1 Tax=Okeania sp. SIO3I5 TaxID=2607805 RepID=UPI0013B92703|nr:putative toxin-antitoxin system toxin component, PIN family [Okeania sp. SIO3I5]NEQ39175.1 putative toxin-antitoxin system toxin component, PIN family [Okeania sp. SIO3I5]